MASKLLKNLKVDELRKVAVDVYSIAVEKGDLKQTIFTYIQNAMNEDQDCGFCDGDCDPESHLFTLNQFQEVPKDTNAVESFSEALANLCKSHNVAVDVPTSEGAVDFASGSAPAPSGTDLLAAVSSQLKGKKKVHTVQKPENSPINLDVSRQTDDGEVIPAGSNNDLMMMMMRQQQVASARQDKMMETVMNFVSGANARSQATIVDLTGTSHDPSQGKIVYRDVPNPEHAAWAGVTLQPLCQVSGDPMQVDLSKLKRKLVSHEQTTAFTAVVREVRWPQMAINPSLCPGGVPPHDRLSKAQFFCGMAMIALTEQNKDSPDGIETTNKLKHTAKVASLAFSWPWEDCLEFNAVLFRALEQAQVNWNDWPQIDAIHNSTEKAINTRVICRQAPPKKIKVDEKKGGGGGGAKERIEGLLISFMREKCLCIKFQSNNCPLPADHEISSKRIVLRHVCGGCLFLNKPEDPSHSAKTCPHRSLFFGN